jgi:hypothetical protein
MGHLNIGPKNDAKAIAYLMYAHLENIPLKKYSVPFITLSLSVDHFFGNLIFCILFIPNSGSR